MMHQVNTCMFECAKTRKHVQETGCSGGQRDLVAGDMGGRFVEIVALQQGRTGEFPGRMGILELVKNTNGGPETAKQGRQGLKNGK